MNSNISLVLDPEPGHDGQVSLQFSFASAQNFF